MKIEELLQMETITEVFTQIESETDLTDRTVETWREQYEGKHGILLKLDKIVGKSGTTGTKLVKLAKLVANYQKKIVRIAVAFVFGKPVKLILADSENKANQTAFEVFMEVWKENNLDNFNKKIMREISIEGRAAELWFPYYDEIEKKTKVKVMMLTEGKGDEFYPHYDDHGVMDALLRKYKIQVMDATTRVREQQRAEIYTATKIIHCKKAFNNKWVEEVEINKSGIVNAIYYDGKRPEWFDVQSLIDRLEVLISKHADTNDYFSSPAVKIKGDIAHAPEKDEVGKVFKLSAEKDSEGKVTWSDIEYLTWEHSPDSLKLEFDNLTNLIYSLSSTPDITFDNVEGIGAISGVALRLMFLDALLKAYDHQELYGEKIEERNNIIKAMVKVYNVKGGVGIDSIEIKVEFSEVIPQNVQELIDMLAIATNGKASMSQESAIQQNPMTGRVEDEIVKIKKDEATTESVEGSLAGSFNI